MRSYLTKFLSKSIIILILFSKNITNLANNEVVAEEPFFTLTLMINDSERKIQIANYAKTQLAEIGIDVDIIIQDWNTFLNQLATNRDYDLTYVSLNFFSYDDPNCSNLFTEDHVLNIWNYDTTIDWDSSKGTGLNEWLIQEGNLIMPPDSAARIQHYWDWQHYLMDEICPLLPAFNLVAIRPHWSNLVGFNAEAGVLQSWGQMYWSGSHTNQYLTNELVIHDNYFTELNPLYQSDHFVDIITEACLDPLVWIDADKSIWPHLLDSITYLNDTTIEATLREGIYWEDYSGFVNEELTIDDVYFTLFCLKELSSKKKDWQWIELLEKIDENTIKIYIDRYPGTVFNDPYAQSLEMLETRIVPEHYLNQSQLGDGITPDTSHSSWLSYSSDCFGTGLFEIMAAASGFDTNLTVRADSWWLDPAVDKSNMDFENRFGTFADYLTQLRIRELTETTNINSEFIDGKLDIIQSYTTEDLDTYYGDATKSTPSYPSVLLDLFAFNMNDTREYTGNRAACPLDSSLTIGCAIRKAIAFAINLDEIDLNVNEEYHYDITYWPMSKSLGIWLNPLIVRYNHNLETAKYFMHLAGFELPGYVSPTGPSFGFGLESYALIIITILGFPTILLVSKRRRNK